MRQTLTWFCMLLLSAQLSACHHKVAIEEDPSERAKATAVAEKYLQAFAESNVPLVLEMSSTPFWGEGDILPDQASLLEALKTQLAHSQQLNYTVKDLKFLTLDQLQTTYPELHQQLVETQFVDGIYAVIMSLEVEGEQEGGMVLVRRGEDGIWRVAGIGD